LLIRPHGSVRWAREVQMSRDTNEDDLILEAGNYGVTDWVVPRGSEGNRAQVPAIAIPTVGKLQFECPPEHIDAFKQHLPKVTRVLTVGWRAQEESFLAILREGLGLDVHGIVISGTAEGATETAGRLNASLGGDIRFTPTTSTEGFSGLIREGRGSLEALAG
jgi:hypothetical protein